jgi:hypothetical protein
MAASYSHIWQKWDFESAAFAIPPLRLGERMFPIGEAKSTLAYERKSGRADSAGQVEQAVDQVVEGGLHVGVGGDGHE